MENEKYFDLVPSVGGSFSFAWRKMFKEAFLPLLLTVIILGLLNGPVGLNWKMDDHDFGLPVLFIFPLALLAWHIH